MRLRELELDEFRSFRKLVLPVDPAGFRAMGPNASGKSTLLEAIAMLATTRSPRTSNEREIPNWASGAELNLPAYTRLRGAFERDDGPHSLEIGLTVDERSARQLKKSIRFDGRSIRAVDAVGLFRVVLFSPEDVSLISGAPAGRRRFLDIAVSQASRFYMRALSRFGRVLEQRNSLLRQLAREGVGPGSARSAEELAFWDAELTAAAVDVIAYRLNATSFLSTRARAHFAELTGDDSLEISYLSHRMVLELPDDPEPRWQSPAQHVRQALHAAFETSLGQVVAEELRRGVTAIGPHRDDLVALASGVDLGTYGSRGQQRLAVIALKLAELDLLQEAGREPPVLLLDDVFSELDPSHRGQVISRLASRVAQVCVTSADESVGGAGFDLAHLPVIHVDRGKVVS